VASGHHQRVSLFLLLLASGLVIWELAEEWSPARNVLEFLPAGAASWLGVSGEAAMSAKMSAQFHASWMASSLAGKDR